MKLNLAVVGATGLVGQTMLKVLSERNVEIGELYLYASARSKGKKVLYNGKEYKIIELNDENIRADIDIALFSAGADISKEYVPKFAKNGTVVIDNSSFFRMDENVPLVVPEVNSDTIKDNKIIANPNCSTITVIPALKYIDDKYGIKRVVYSTYQSVSGAGQQGLQDLENNLKGEKSTKFTSQIAFNLIPYIDKFDENTGYTKEELKMINETRKILSKPDMKITATCVRVPVRYSHAVSVNLELEKSFDLEELKAGLAKSAGVVLEDLPMPIDVEGKDKTYVGRVRRDFSVENGLNLWIVADNIRKGAATNAVQIAQQIILLKEVNG